MTWQFVKSQPGHDPIIVESYFAATPDKVFRAWTDPDMVRRWFGPAPNSLQSATIDLRPGGVWRFLESSNENGSVGFEGEYLTIETNQRLVFTWSKFMTRADEQVEPDFQATPRSHVEVLFTPTGSGTSIRLVHSAVHDEDTRRGFGGGWDRALGTMSALFST